MKKFDLVYNKIIKEDAEERAWEYRQIQDAAKKAKAAKKKGQKVNYNKLADEYGVSAGDIKKACNESVEGLHSDAEVVAQDVRKLHALLDHLSQSIDSGLIQWSRENQDSNEDAVRILNLSDDLGEYARIFRKQLADERQLRS